jgi:hypothetical protein
MNQPTKIDYWWDMNVTMRWHEFLCRHNYHRIVWESDGFEHCQCGETIKLNSIEDNPIPFDELTNTHRL